ncbi:MAG TPA: 50S ribosomal protein L4, partial [Acidimicrobiales bacterium]|nr:50S ribosomal protein L4 [Acidimicrobiales bacterium]
MTTTQTSFVRRRTPAEPQRRVVQRRRMDGGDLGAVVLDPRIFGITPNVAVLHQVVTAQLAAARSGTQSTRTRAEVAGGGSKPFRQKGTGRSRQGSIRSPQWVGGGVALGPKPRKYRQRTPKKMIRLALVSALSDRALEGRVALVDEWGLDEPRTKDALLSLRALGLRGRVLVVTGDDDFVADRSFRNLRHVQCVPVAELNAYDVIRNEWVLFSDATLPGETQTATADEISRTEAADTEAQKSVDRSAKEVAKPAKAAKAAKAQKVSQVSKATDASQTSETSEAAEEVSAPEDAPAEEPEA